MEEKARKILEFLTLIEPLKSVTRHSWCSDGRHESVAEHTWRTAVMAVLIQDEFPDVDFKKVLEMCLLHDLGEINGDIPAFQKKLEDEKSEFEDLQNLVRVLPISLEEKIIALQKEFNACVTPEAKIANALDKLEALIQHNDADLSTWNDIEYELNLTYGHDQTNFHPFLKTLRELVRQKSASKIKQG